MKKGLFITFEGNDGSGKTTMAQLIYDRLKQEGYDVILTREPGGIEIAEKIRDIILDPANTEMDARCEALLYAASRRQHLAQKVIPALKDKKIVICDRFIDSSLAYQGHARGIGIDEVYELNLFAIDSYMPDLTLFFKISVEEAKKRMDERGNLNRLDQEQSDFHQKVREGYELICQKYPQRIKVIDAHPAIEIVLEDVYQNIKQFIKAYEE